MPTARQLVASRCPECSAPVDLKQVPTSVDQIRCAYCGTPLLLPKRNVSAETPPAYRPPVTPPPFRQTRLPIQGRSLPRGPFIAMPASPKRKGNAGCGIVVSLLIFGVMLASDVGIFRALESAFGKEVSNPGELIARLGSTWAPAVFVGHLYGNPVAVLGLNSESVDTLLIQSRNNDDEGLVLSIDPQSETLRWRAGPFSRNFVDTIMTAGPRYIYVGDQGRLTALDRETGEQVWQISLANHLASPCPTCLQYMAGYVIALTRDGTIQSFEGASGLPAWSRQLNTTPRMLYNVGGQPAVVDSNERNHAHFVLLDRISGAELQSIRPVCESDGREAFVSPHTPFVVSSDGLRLHILGSGNLACAWRYNLVTGALEWLYRDSRETQILPFSWTGEGYLIRDGVLYTTQRSSQTGVLRAVDSHSGLAQELSQFPQYELELIAVGSHTLVAIATPTFARNEPELWGIDRESGARRWQAQLDIAHSFDKLFVQSGPAGLFVGQCLWEARVCLFEIVDIDTGVSAGQTRQSVGGSVSGTHFKGNHLWMNAWGKLYAVNLADATVEMVWP